jgi:transposase
VLSVSDDHQQGFFDAGWCGDVVDPDSFYGLLAEHGQRIVRDEDFAPCYAEHMGRPSVPPAKLARVLLLAYREGIGDEQAMERLRYDLRWKVAVGVPFDHKGWHPTTLVRFRARLLLHGMERLALERSVALALELRILEGRAEQILDSTPMLGAAATQDTVRLVRCGVRKLIDAVDGADPQAAAVLRRDLQFDYARPREKPDCDWRKKAAREEMLTAVAKDAERALRAVKAEPGLAQKESVAEAVTLLRELVGQDFEVDHEDVPRLRRGVATGRILSVVDTEMRHGRKSHSQRFDGYKIHAGASGDGRLITAVEVSAGCDHDGHHAAALIDQQPAPVRPRRILGDTAYGDQTTRQELERRGVEVLAPVPEGPAHDDRLSKSDFQIDLVAGTVTCPAGQLARLGRARRDGARWASFPRAGCGGCPFASRCVDARGRRQIQVQPREDLLIAGRRALGKPATREHLRRTRPLIERPLGLLARRYHARKARYFGKQKALLQAAWSAVLVNLHPIGAALRTRTA